MRVSLKQESDNAIPGEGQKSTEIWKMSSVPRRSGY